MPYFVFRTGNIVSIIQTPEKPEIYGTPFKTVEEANIYREQIEKHHGLPQLLHAFNLWPTPLTVGRKTSVICVEKNVRYESVQDAAIDCDVSASAISNHIKNPVRNPHVKGLTFKRVI